MIQKLKKSNAGFTLVELIVVIAILGVLAAVLVPQYIQYVEKAREGSDRNTISEIYHAAEITAASTENLAAGDILTITVTKADGSVAYGGTFATQVAAICPTATSTMKSTSGKGTAATTVYTVTYSATTGVGWKTAVPSIGGTAVGGKLST